MSFIQANSLLITGGEFKQDVSSVDDINKALETLLGKAAPAGFHNSAERGDPPKCHPETRTAVQNDIVEVVKAALKACIIWLYGAAGAGKSAIAQTIAEKCDSLNKSQALLLGSFFFFRTSPLRNNISRLGASLAYQLARAIPSTLPYIAEHMKDDPAVFESNLETQLINLFIQPLHRACQDHPELCSQARLIILDGLDELDNVNDQKHVIGVLTQVLQQCPIPLIVLITSRPEVHITVSFNSLEATEVQIRRIDLNTGYSAESDIRLYLHHAFSMIKRKSRFQQFLPYKWPAHNDVEKIVYKSSDQFIFAATIVRYVDSDKHNPENRLREALDLSERYAAKVKNSPFRELDALYMQIFSGVEDPVVTLAILYYNVLYYNVNNTMYSMGISRRRMPRSPYSIEQHLQLPYGGIEEHLSALPSLVKVNREANQIDLYHKSLADFLLNKDRSFEFFVDQPSVHLFLLKIYLHHAVNQGVVPLYISLFSVRKHLALVDQNNIELPGLLTHFQHSISTILNGGYQGVDDFRQPFFIDILHEISEVLDDFSLNDGFWETCVKAVMDIFLDFISQYPRRPGSSELLTAALYGSQTFTFPDSSLAEALQIEKSTWSACATFFDQRFTYLLDNRNTLKIVQQLLRNQRLSGVNHITDQIMVRTARLCVGVVDRFLSAEYVRWSSSEAALWAARVLMGILKVVPCNLELFDALYQLKFGHYLCYEFVVLADAISSYNEAHDAQAAEERARSGGESSRTVVAQVSPPIGNSERGSRKRKEAPAKTIQTRSQSAAKRKRTEPEKLQPDFSVHQSP